MSHGNTPSAFSPVFFMSHAADVSRTFPFVRAHTSVAGVSLTLSATHLARLADGRLVAGGALRANGAHQLLVADGAGGVQEANVTDVSRVRAGGLYNPHTLHGDVVVDGVLASTFTTAVRPAAARVLLAPFAAWFRAAGAGWGLRAANRVVLAALARA